MKTRRQERAATYLGALDLLSQSSGSPLVQNIVHLSLMPFSLKLLFSASSNTTQIFSSFDERFAISFSTPKALFSSWAWCFRMLISSFTTPEMRPSAMVVDYVVETTQLPSQFPRIALLSIIFKYSSKEWLEIELFFVDYPMRKRFLRGQYSFSDSSAWISRLEWHKWVFRNMRSPIPLSTSSFPFFLDYSFQQFSRSCSASQQ
nr:hypothetical protein Iba_chr06bCG15470 [Ipomoea batatas]